MTDYSFMRSGLGGSVERPLSEDDQTNINSMLTLFTSNAMMTGVKYSKICGRNGVSQEDVKYGLIFEVFEFTNRSTTMDDLNEIRNELKEEDDNEDNYEDIEEFIVPDDEIDDFTRVNIDDVSEENKEFVKKIHDYYDNWSSWNPSNRIEEILKNAIDTIN